MASGFFLSVQRTAATPRVLQRSPPLAPATAVTVSGGCLSAFFNVRESRGKLRCGCWCLPGARFVPCQSRSLRYANMHTLSNARYKCVHAVVSHCIVNASMRSGSRDKLTIDHVHNVGKQTRFHVRQREYMKPFILWKMWAVMIFY